MVEMLLKSNLVVDNLKLLVLNIVYGTWSKRGLVLQVPVHDLALSRRQEDRRCRHELQAAPLARVMRRC